LLQLYEYLTERRAERGKGLGVYTTLTRTQLEECSTRSSSLRNDPRSFPISLELPSFCARFLFTGIITFSEDGDATEDAPTFCFRLVFARAEQPETILVTREFSGIVAARQFTPALNHD
jgi:hypothetical protein